MPLTNPSSQWTVTNTPAAATEATATKAAATGVVHVAKRVMCSFAAGATAGVPVAVNLRDGATGAGTVLASWIVAVPANGAVVIDANDLHLVGTAGNAMTLEFGGAGAATTVQSVTLVGYDQ